MTWGVINSVLNKAVLLLATLVLCIACSKAPKETDFAGQWRSSKLITPIYLYKNGEWEIKTNDGVVLQYGVWRYENNKIIWSFKLGSVIQHDANLVLSLKKNEFSLKEQDGSTTTFQRLGPSTLPKPYKYPA